MASFSSRLVAMVRGPKLLMILLGLGLAAGSSRDQRPALAKASRPALLLAADVARPIGSPGTSPRRSNAAVPAEEASSNDASGAKETYDSAIVTTLWSFVVTIAFGLGLVLPLRGASGCVDFFTAFLVEKSLSVDNLFVFLMLFEYFKVPEEYTGRVLRWGILSALALRGVMIAAGVLVIQRFRPVLLLFSAVLVVSAVKMLHPEGKEDELADNAILRIARSLVDATDSYDGEKFFTMEGGQASLSFQPALASRPPRQSTAAAS